MADGNGGENSAERPFSLTLDDLGNAVMILGETRLNLGPYEAAAEMMADWLGQLDSEG